MRRQKRLKDLFFDWLLIIAAVIFCRIVLDPKFARGSVPNLNILALAIASVLAIVYFHSLNTERFWIRATSSILLGIFTAGLVVIWILAVGVF